MKRHCVRGWLQARRTSLVILGRTGYNSYGYKHRHFNLSKNFDISRTVWTRLKKRIGDRSTSKLETNHYCCQKVNDLYILKSALILIWKFWLLPLPVPCKKQNQRDNPMFQLVVVACGMKESICSTVSSHRRKENREYWEHTKVLQSILKNIIMLRGTPSCSCTWCVVSKEMLLPKLQNALHDQKIHTTTRSRCTTTTYSV